jgi:septum formation protein
MQSPSKPLIYLASASPRRSQLLRQIGVEHEVRPVGVDESLRPGEPPGGYVARLAREKAMALWAQLVPAARRPVLGSDTTVAVDDSIQGKPRDAQDALQMLRRLSARTHQVYTAVALCHAQGCDLRLSVSDVTFRSLSDSEIEAYWASGEPADKAGGYAVQGLGALFIERIAGSYSGIMGLPLFETGELLASVGWSFAKPASQTTGAVQAGRA